MNNLKQNGIVCIIFIIIGIFMCFDASAESLKTTNEINLSTNEVSQTHSAANMNSTAEIKFNNLSEAIEKTKESKKYLFTIFYNDAKDEKLKKLEENITKFKNTSTAEIVLYRVNITDTKEAEMISKYQLNQGAPIPIALVFAPNGAVIGGLTPEMPESDYSKVIVSALTMEILKTVQTGKIALVMLQNPQTKFNAESEKAAKETTSDAKIGNFIQIVKADPAETANKDFLKMCKLEEKLSEAAIVVIVPPASIAGVLKGNITKETIMGTLVSSCGSGGCGSGGCK